MVVGATTLALGAGFLAGYYFAKHSLENKIQAEAEERITQEVEAARRYVIQREDKPKTPAEAVEALIPEAADALRLYREGKKEEPPPSKEPATPDETKDMVDSEGGIAFQQTRYHKMGADIPNKEIPPERRNNIWDTAKSEPGVEFDYVDEVNARTDDAPYIISHEEFLENKPENRQVNLTYFEGDDILIDWEDEIVNDVNSWVGKQNLRFGHRSEDNNLVYIRNPVINFDFQIARSTGSYRSEVAGFDQEVGKQ